MGATDFGSLAATLGIPGALLALAVVAIWRLYVKALHDKDTAYQRLLEDRDEENQKLEARNAALEARLYQVLDKGDLLADLAGAPRPPPARRRRSDV